MAFIDKRSILALFSTLFIGFVVIYLIWGFPLAAIFAILWIDKVLIGAIGAVRYIGVEFTTIATVLLGFLYDPVFSFLFALLLLPLMHAMKYIFLPLPQPEWPFFVPSPYNIIDAVAALAASFLSWLPFFHAVIVIVILKDIGYAVVEKAMISKPVDFISAITYIIFNLVIAAHFGPFFLGLVGLPA